MITNRKSLLQKDGTLLIIKTLVIMLMVMVKITTIKFETKVIKPNLCDYSDAYILVIGNIQNKLANSVMAFKNCAPFRTCDVTINDEHVEKAEDLDIVMPMYNLLEYSDNYQDSRGSLYQFKRDEPPDDNANVADDTASLGYKSKLIKGADDNNVNNVKLLVLLKYVSNFLCEKYH